MKGQLKVDWTFSPEIHTVETVERLAQTFLEQLQALITHCQSAALGSEVGRRTPSDFPMVTITQAELDTLPAKLKGDRTYHWRDIEDIYPLSPTQHGMLFHSLYDPEAGSYVEKMIFSVKGELNVDDFLSAWQQVSDRYPILRTAFLWQQSQPVQVVLSQVTVPFTVHNWRSESPAQQQQALETLLEKDRQAGFAIAQAPWMRLHLIRLNDNHHQVIWSHHHSLLDGWSLPLVLEAVLTSYEAQCNAGVQFTNKSVDEKSADEQSPDEKSAPSYRQYIHWLKQQDNNAAKAFWQKQLAGFTAPTPISSRASNTHPQQLSHPSDHQTSDHKAPEYKTEVFSLSVAQTQTLKSFVRRHQLTLSNLIQGAWALLLSRYSGESNVVFGTTVAGRPAALAAVDSMVGLFINTLPMRVEIDTHAALISWLKEIQTQQLQLDEYAYTSLAELQTWSELPTGTPLFDTLVVFENYPIDGALKQQVSRLEMTLEDIHARTNFPLTLVATVEESLAIELQYNTTLFEAGTLRRMCEHLQTLLVSMVERPMQTLQNIKMLTDAEQQQLLTEWNNTQAEHLLNQTLPELIELQVERTPNAIALVFESKQLTYHQLNQQANQLAHYLQSVGVGPEVLVGICVERSIEMVVGLLAILKAGGAYVPLDPTYPSERLQYMLNDAQVTVLLTQQQLAKQLTEQLSDQEFLCICLDALPKTVAEQNTDNPDHGLTPQNLAYVIYNSGSTGQPKGAVNTQQGICNRLLWMQERYGLTVEDRVLQKTPFSFDVSVWEFFWPLLAGAVLVVAKPEGHKDVTYLIDIIRQQGITTLHFVPSMLQVFLKEALSSNC